MTGGGRWRALVATSNKRGLVELGRGLEAMGWEIAATKGTAAVLRGASIAAIDVETIANAPEMLEGRLKTLTLNVFGGLLMRRGRRQDEDEARQWGFSPIDMLVSGFYEIQVPSAPGRGGQDWIDRIDVGGPSMLRAAAKNHQFVIPLVDPDDYRGVLDALLARKGDPAGISSALRRHLAGKAFKSLGRYDQAIATLFERPQDDDR